MIRKLRCEILLFFLFTATIARAENVDAIISQARSCLGDEERLESVEAIEYRGRVIDSEGDEVGAVLLQFKKPYFQRLQFETEDAIETTAVNGFEGWQSRVDKHEPENGGVRVLDSMETQYLLYNVHENLNFFKGPRQISGGNIYFDGIVEKHGASAYKVVFAYPHGLTYTRFFDVETGLLLATIAGHNGYEMVETEALSVNGIKFPKRVETYRDEQLQRSVVFDEIIVNPEVDSQVFDFPEG